MASLKDIKRRIKSVKSTQKITNAMKLVSASKFARATHAVQASRPYGESFDQMVQKLVAVAGDSESKLLEQREEKRTLIVVVGSDRGLCGALNTNVFKVSQRLIDEKTSEGVEITLRGWGRRPLQFCRSIDGSSEGQEKVLEKPNYALACELGAYLMDQFESDKCDAIYIAYPKFKSAIEQPPTIKKLLPFSMEGSENGVPSEGFLVEPDIQTVLPRLVSRWVNSSIHRILLEAMASEHGARMSAMENATNNAKEVTRKLTLKYNRARQAAITTELTEIISGAEALN